MDVVIYLINCKIVIVGETGMNSTVNIDIPKKNIDMPKKTIPRKDLDRDVRRVIEYLEGAGPRSLVSLISDLGIVNYAAISHIAQARDLGLIELKDGKYQVVE
jgi:hypothetical protein